MYTCVLLRYGEVGLKSRRKRPVFERLFVEGIDGALRKNKIKGYQIKNLGKRFIVSNKDIQTIIPILQRVPGIQSLSPSVEIKFEEKEELVDKVYDFAKELVKDKIFWVKVKRIGDHEFDSIQLASSVGDKLYDLSKGVSSKKAEVTIKLEIRQNSCYLFTQTIDCMGGLPPKSAGKVLCMFSGGIDSPVAAYLMLKRGCEIDFLFINLVGEKSLNDTLNVYNYVISQYAFGYTPKMFVVDGTKLVKEITAKVPDTLRQIALKIAFYKIGEKIARENKYPSLVTGEALSQKSSQTVQSLAVIQSQANIPVLRPLIAFDKLEITRIAEKIGTFAYSQKVKEYCNLSEGPVYTTPTAAVLPKIPSFDDVIENCDVKVYKGIIEVEEDTVVTLKNVISVDIRAESRKQAQPLEADMRVPYPEILEQMEKFEKDRSYLIVCDFSVRSEDVAYKLRKKGINAAAINLRNYLKYVAPVQKH